mgnify:FL=1
MPWCPKCKTKYGEGFEFCSDCGSELVNVSDTVEENDNEYDTEAFLISVASDIEANLYISLLDSYQIPVRKRYRGAGDYIEIYMGMTNLGIDLYVPSKLLEQAMDIIQNKSSETDEKLDAEEIPPELENKYKFRQRFGAWIILLAFIPGFIGIIIMLLNFILYITRF